MIVNVETPHAPVGQDLIDTLMNQFIRVEFSDGRNVEGVAKRVGGSSGTQHLVSVGGWVTLSDGELCYAPIESIGVLAGSFGFVTVWSKENYEESLRAADPKHSDYYVRMSESEDVWQCGDCHAFWPITLDYCPNVEIDELVVEIKHLHRHLEDPSAPCYAVLEKRPCAYERVFMVAMKEFTKTMDNKTKAMFDPSYSRSYCGSFE